MIGLFIAAAGVTFVLFAVAGLQVALGFREVDVPNLAGQTLDDTTARLGDAGLALRIDPLTRIHPTIPGRVRRRSGPGRRSDDAKSTERQGVAELWTERRFGTFPDRAV